VFKRVAGLAPVLSSGGGWERGYVEILVMMQSSLFEKILKIKLGNINGLEIQKH
jgi:hypothetical protein